jgi:hypothetical protein
MIAYRGGGALDERGEASHHGRVQSWPGSASAAIRVTPSRMVVDGAGRG